MSGIEALLLKGAITTHAQYGVPIPCYSTSRCNLHNKEELRNEILAADVIIIDECYMANKDLINCLEISIQELVKQHTAVDMPFGGKVVIFGGDARQTLNVEPRQGRAGITAKNIIRSRIWRNVERLQLTINERTLRAINQDTPPEVVEGINKFNDFILQVGNGTLQVHPEISPSSVRIPDEYVFQSQNPKDLLQWTYPNIANGFTIADADGTAILTPLNKDVDMLNAMAMDMMTHQPTTYCYSSDSILQDGENDDANAYPVEFLNSQTPSGFLNITFTVLYITIYTDIF